MRLYQKFFVFVSFLTGVFIFYISSLEFLPNPLPSFSYTSIVYHIGIFFLFSLFLFLAGEKNKEYLFLVLILSFVYAVLDELHQYFVPGRVAGLFDIGLNSLGILIGLLFILIFKKR